jgi:ribosomal protein S28E/S33
VTDLIACNIFERRRHGHVLTRNGPWLLQPVRLDQLLNSPWKTLFWVDFLRGLPRLFSFAPRLPKAVPMAFRKTLRALALPKASTGFGGRSSQGSHTITVFGATGMTGKKAIVFGRNTTKIKKK